MRQLRCSRRNRSATDYLCPRWQSTSPRRSAGCVSPRPYARRRALAVTPSTREDYLYDDIMDARRRSGSTVASSPILERFCEVHEVRDLLAEVLETPRCAAARPRDAGHRALGAARPRDRGAGCRRAGRDAHRRPRRDAGSPRRARSTNPATSCLRCRTCSSRATPRSVVDEHVLIGSMRYGIRWTEELDHEGALPPPPAAREQGNPLRRLGPSVG